MNCRRAAVVATLVLPPAATPAHVGEVVYPIYELPSADRPDLHDESLADWDAVLPDASLYHNRFVYYSGLGERIDPSDLAWRVFLAWHHRTQRIYMAVERLDDVYLPPSEDCCGEGAAALSIDGDHSDGAVLPVHRGAGLLRGAAPAPGAGPGAELLLPARSTAAAWPTPGSPCRPGATGAGPSMERIRTSRLASST